MSLTSIFIIIILFLGFLITFQIAKASEYVSILKGEKKTLEQNNRVNAFLLILFLVGGLIGVLFTTHAAAYAWALWDGDWLRVRPIFWQAPPTGLLFILLPLLHPGDLRPYVGNALALYYAVAGLVVLSSLGIILSYRATERAVPSHAQ